MAFDLEKFSDVKVLVIGDIMLDRYLWGDVKRISPEAPVPVVRVEERSEVLGGAGNVVSNLSGLGCSVSVSGVCGTDENGTKLKRLFSGNSVETFIFDDKKRPTISKTRIMAHNQQLFRLDEEKTHVLSDELAFRILDKIRKTLSGFNAVILSDYGKGIFNTGDFCQKVIRMCQKRSIPVFVDPKGKDWERYKGATCVTPNAQELGLVSQVTIDGNEEKLIEIAQTVCEKYDFSWLLVTRGSKGMCLVEKKKEHSLISSKAREVYDVSGAGDTVISTLAAGISCGLSFLEAAELANNAAGVVVGKLGTQPIIRTELEAVLKMNDGRAQMGTAGKILSRSAGILQAQAFRANGEKIVFTNGCYDLLHPGHIDLLHKSKALGDRLVVGLNTDQSVRRLKGEKRPILSENDRSAILSALECVDLVILFDEDTPLKLIQSLKPDILVKGADYKLDEVVGREEVESYGGEVALVPLLEGYSTTGIVNKLISTYDKKST